MTGLDPDDAAWAADDAPVTLLGPCPAWCDRRVLELAPGAEHPYDPDEWRDALVVVERGEVVLEGVAGGRLRARTGAVLTLHGVPLRALHNLGDEPALLVAVARHGPRPDD